MIKLKALAGAVTLLVLTTACAGGEPETGETAGEDASDQKVTEKTPDEEAAVADGDPMATKDGVALASLTGDPAKGKTAFAQCRTCHVTDPGVNRLGPSLAGLVGSKAGSVEGFNYSPANKSSGLTWSEEQLYVYLEDPQRVVPKTKMIFAGIPDAQKGVDLIAFLKDPS